MEVGKAEPRVRRHERILTNLAFAFRETGFVRAGGPAKNLRDNYLAEIDVAIMRAGVGKMQVEV